MLHFITREGADLMKRYNKYLDSPPPIEIISAARNNIAFLAHQLKTNDLKRICH